MKRITLDIETIGLDPWFQPTIWIVALFDGKTQTVIEDCNGLKTKAVKQLKRICEDKSIQKVIHNASFDCTYLEVVFGIKTVNIWDTMLAEQVLMGFRTEKSNPKHIIESFSSALEYTLPRYGFKSPNKSLRENFINRPKGKPFTKAEIDYAKGDTKYLLKLAASQDYVLQRDKLIEVALLENKDVERTIRMRVNGVCFDQDYWRNLAIKNEKEYNSLMAKLPKGINWKSHAQVKKYFAARHGVNVEKIKDLRKQVSTLNIPVLSLYNQVQGMAKDISTYGNNWFDGTIIKPDGKIHPDYFQMVDSGRYSCINPNLQNQKSKSLHRGAFIPSPGNKFVRGDFSGQELAIMAAAANEKLWIDTLLRGDDLHSVTAKVLYGKLWDKGATSKCTFPKKCDCPKHIVLRSNAKGLNFTLAYGGGAPNISEKTGLSLFDAKVLIMQYKKIIPNINNWLEKNGEYALYHSAIYSADKYMRFRRLRVLPEEDWHVINQGKNTPVQSAGANMLKLSMISLSESAQYLALTIHDEIILDVPNKFVNKAAKELKAVMSQSADYITGIKGLVKVEPEISMNLLKS